MLKVKYVSCFIAIISLLSVILVGCNDHNTGLTSPTVLTKQPNDKNLLKRFNEEGMKYGDNGVYLYVRFSSYNYPDYYIRHQNFLGELTRIYTNLDIQDSWFKLKPGLAHDGTDYYSFESVNYPGYFLRHQNFRIKLHKFSNDSLFKKDATFKAVDGLADNSRLSFRSYNYPNHYLRHASFHLYLHQGSSWLFKKDATFKLAAMSSGS